MSIANAGELVIMAEQETRERCAQIAESLARGVGIEINGTHYPLGIMAMSEGVAQELTAKAIAAAIRAS